MKQITFNPSNEPYYSEDFIKGFECGTQRQLEADLADRPQGEWAKRTHYTLIAQVNFAYCSECGQPIMHEHTRPLWSYCPNCGAKMDGERKESE